MNDKFEKESDESHWPACLSTGLDKDEGAALEEACDRFPPGRADAPTPRWRQTLVQAGLSLAAKRHARSQEHAGSDKENLDTKMVRFASEDELPQALVKENGKTNKNP